MFVIATYILFFFVQVCEDIDECADGTHKCDKNAHCINKLVSLIGTYSLNFKH